MSEEVYADLHTHTNCSDGILAPEALVSRGVDRGLGAISVTDHDTVEGQSTARAAAEEEGIEFVTGVELSVTVDQTEVHVLAYGIDPSHEGLLDHLRWMRRVRRRRLRRILDRLREVGISLDEDMLREEVATTSSVGRPHVAAALVRAGHVEAPAQAFDEYLAKGQPAFVEKPEVPAEEALALVHEAGGVGVLAHPGHWTSSRCVRRLVEVGLDGIETVHPAHDATLRTYYERMADGYGLLQTGGSDYHGRSSDDADVGTVGLTRSEWERFRRAAL